MKKRDFLLKALNSGVAKKRAWVVSAFALTREGPDDWRENPYEFRVVHTPINVFYVNDVRQLVLIEDAEPNKPLFDARLDRIQLKPGDLPNVDREIDTTVGNALLNTVTLGYWFKNKIPFMTGRFAPKDQESKILPILIDDPEDGTPPPDDKIVISEYLQFRDAVFYMTNFMQLFTPAATKKTMIEPPGIRELKYRLLEENKDRLDDPAVIAQIDAQLVQHIRDFLKGDRGADFLISGKSINIVAKKLYGMVGAEPGLEEKVTVDLVSRSLNEGWDPRKLPTMLNAARAGSFYRGKQTELGGVVVKEILRASQNINIVDTDCGTRVGDPMFITGSNYKKLINSSIVDKDGALAIDTEDQAKTFIGKRVMRRSPAYCKLDHTDRCAVCAGKDLAASPDAASVACAQVGSDFMLIFMSAAHSKGTSVQLLDIDEEMAFS